MAESLGFAALSYIALREREKKKEKLKLEQKKESSRGASPLSSPVGNLDTGSIGSRGHPSASVIASGSGSGSGSGIGSPAGTSTSLALKGTEQSQYLFKGGEQVKRGVLSTRQITNNGNLNSPSSLANKSSLGNSSAPSTPGSEKGFFNSPHNTSGPVQSISGFGGLSSPAIQRQLSPSAASRTNSPSTLSPSHSARQQPLSTPPTASPRSPMGSGSLWRLNELSPTHSGGSTRSNRDRERERLPVSSTSSSQVIGKLGHDPFWSPKDDSTTSTNDSPTASPSSSKSFTLNKAKSFFSGVGKPLKSPDPLPFPSPPPASIGPSHSKSYPASIGLSHSKSYGSLQSGTSYSATTEATHGSPSTSHRFNNNSHDDSFHLPQHVYPSLASSLSPSSHPYASSTLSMRQSSLPNKERKRQNAPEEDTACPVCLEPLSIRLAGEKPHIVPVCGHRLHAECFDAAYGSNIQKGSGRQKKGPFGICGICRSEMKISEDGPVGKNKFATISGQDPMPFNDPYDSEVKRTTTDNDASGTSSLHNPSEDQEIVTLPQQHPHMQHTALNSSRGDKGTLTKEQQRVWPKVSVRAEHPNIARLSDPEQKVYLTCMVTVQVPSRVTTTTTLSRSLNGHRSHQANNSQSTIAAVSAFSSSKGPVMTTLRRESNATSKTGGTTEEFPTSPSGSTFSSGVSQSLPNHMQNRFGMSQGMEQTSSTTSTALSSNLTPGTANTSTFTTPGSLSASSFSSVDSTGGGGSEGGGNYSAANAASNVTLTTAAQEEKDREAHGPFAGVFEDLQNRMADWKGHQPAYFGSLRMWDSLRVKKDKNVREFVVYLFEEALLCVVDDSKKREFLPNGGDKLRLKGRVFVRHMQSIEETTSADTGLSLTIHMEDDSLESFVILFHEREVLEVWRSQIQALIDHHRPPIPQSKPMSSVQSYDSANADRRDSVFSAGTSRSAMSSVSKGTKATTASSLSTSVSQAKQAMPEKTIPPVPTPTSSSALGNVLTSPRLAQNDNDDIANWQPPSSDTFVPIDLMLVLAVPALYASGPSSSALKMRLLKSTLDFVIHAVGPRARISIVAFTVGDASSGTLRKTPWLATGNPLGMRRLEQSINDIVGEPDPTQQNYQGLVSVNPKEDKVTVATAVNLALDIILQRHSKSATSGMILLNDGKDGAQKQQIDLVMTRADASKIPIHTFGWGRTHDPSSLWLLSNHTRGTYTFVRDYYQLKEAIAGCIGGLLSVAVGTLKLHLNVQERRWFKIRKVAGVGTAIVSSDGKDVDISMGELRYGEKKEMLVEIEMASPKGASGKALATKTLNRSSLTATDSFFVKRAGMDPGSLTDLQQDFYDEVEDGMADDVPIFEVNTSFRDPLDPGNTTLKLPYPTLLTTTVMPPNQAGQENPLANISPSMVSDPTIVRRRMELLTSDMITRTLLLMSRRQDVQAQRLLIETTRIFGAILANLVPPSSGNDDDHHHDIADIGLSHETRYAHDVLLACLEDVERLRLGCAVRSEFEQVSRNCGAQQAVTLRDQCAWTDRTATEALFFCKEWTAIFGKSLNASSA